MAELREDTLPIERLLLDPNNYRFQARGDFIRVKPDRFAEPTVQAKAQVRLRDESLRELKASILANGFIPIERIVVRAIDGNFLVLEGNRRLAALRWILEEHKAGAEVDPKLLKLMGAIPVIIVEGEEDGALYSALMGIRHVSGIKQWKGYERAQLVQELIDKHSLDSGEVADRLGMSKVEVNRRYRAMKALEQMETDEDYGEYADASLYPIFHEALSQPVVREWLDWNNESNRFEDVSNRESLYAMITPAKPEDDDEDEAPPKLTTYSDVRLLRDILPSDTATRILLDPDRDLAEAVAVVQTTQVSQAWRSQVARTIESLARLGLDQVTGLTDDDIAQLKGLMAACETVLTSHGKLTKN